MLALAFSGLGFLYYYRRRRTMIIAKRMDGGAELKTTSRVLKLTKETRAAEKN
jgi:hypothetical protein